MVEYTWLQLGSLSTLLIILLIVEVRGRGGGGGAQYIKGGPAHQLALSSSRHAERRAPPVACPCLGVRSFLVVPHKSWSPSFNTGVGAAALVVLLPCCCRPLWCR
jgi:hypothetical protein